MKFKDLKIGAKLSIAIFAALLMLVSVFYLSGMYVQDRLLKLEIQRKLQHIKDMFYNLKERDTHMLTSALDVFLQDQDFKKVYLEKNRGKLFQYGQPLFQKLKTEHGITHLYFILPDGTCFVRLHNQDIYGDMIDRLTFKEAKATKGLGAGIELGKTAFALRAVKPYYQDNELIGYVEFGQEIEHFLKVLKGDAGDEFAIIGDKKYMDRKDWLGLRQAAGLKDNWNDMDKHILLAQTTKEPHLAEFFAEDNVECAEKEPVFIKRIRFKDKFFAGSGFSILNHEGKDIGVVLVLDNITDFVAGARKTNSLLLGIITVLFISGILFSYLFIAKIIIKPISGIYSGVRKISQGDLSSRIEVGSKDEIGELADSFNKMTENLKISKDKIEEYSEGLEKKVVARTKDLRDANISLEKRGKELEKAKQELQTHVEEIAQNQRALLLMLEDTNRMKKEVVEKSEELKKRVDELTNARTATMNMLEDINEAREKIERAYQELSQAQDRLLRTERFAAMGRLAGSISHELRNPLGVMRNSVYYLNLMEVGKSEKSVQEHLDILDKEIGISDRIIGDILDFSRIKKPTLSKIKVNDVVHQTLSQMKVPENIEVLAELAQDIPEADLDPLQMQQVFFNIILNAFEVMPGGGKLKVTTHLEQEFIHIGFKDSGPGITKENLEKIFEPLFTTKPKGIGLGLALCRSIVEGHEGTIEVESEEGRGATFTVKLPFKMKGA